MTFGHDSFFPFPPSVMHYPYRDEYSKGQDGVTKREVFAAYFMAEAIKVSPQTASAVAAERAVERADALIKALNQ